MLGVVMLKKLVGVVALSLIMLCSVVPAFAATQSATQPVQVTVGPTVSNSSILEQWR